jgi:uridine monophosphate synthetase
MTSLSYQERVHYTLSKTGQRLLHLMEEKKTNLALSADVIHAQELLDLAKQLGPEICVLKTHIDIVEDFSHDLIRELSILANTHQFLIFEDRKFADIGNTVKQQYQHGVYQIAAWADIVNAHTLPGPGIIQGLAEIGRKEKRGLLLIAEMSSKNNLITKEYIQQTLKMAEGFTDFVMGFITQHALSNDPHWINFTPGIKLAAGDDALGQQYVTPEKAILEHGTDVIIVGRGITEAKDKVKMAQEYRQTGWQAYLKRLGR